MENELTRILSTQEELCDELAACSYLDRRLMCTVIKHPLLIEIFHTKELNALANTRLAMKRKAVDEAIKKKKFGAVVMYYERPFRLNAVVRLINDHSIKPKLVGEILSWVWIDSESIHENIKTWKKLIRIYQADIRRAQNPEDKKVFKALPDSITVYRGHQHINKSGLSWTLDKEKALWFAKRFSAGGDVAERTIKKTKIAFYTNARGEQEVVVL